MKIALHTVLALLAINIAQKSHQFALITISDKYSLENESTPNPSERHKFHANCIILSQVMKSSNLAPFIPKLLTFL